MRLKIDKTVYSDSCISKCVYHLSGRYSILRSIEGDAEILEIAPLSESGNTEEQIEIDIINTLNDFKLRDIINEQTKDIRTIIYAKAFSEYNDSNT